MTNKANREAESAKLRELYEIKKSEEKRKGGVFNQSSIAKIGSWTQPTVSGYLNGTVELKEESAVVFSKALGVQISTFSPRIAEKIAQREMLAKNPLLSRVHVSYLPKLTVAEIQKIRNYLRDENFIMPQTEETTPIAKKLSTNAFSFDIVDHSLESKINKGTTLIFDPMIQPKPMDIVFVGNKLKDDDFHIREYHVLNIDSEGVENYELKALNPAYPTLPDNYEVLAVAVATVNYF